MRMPDIDYTMGAPLAEEISPDSMDKWLPIVHKTAESFMKVKEANDELKTNEAAIALLQANEHIESTLMNADAINLDANPFSPSANESIKNSLADNDITQVGQSRWAPTEKVMRDAYDNTMRDAFDQITEGMSNSQKQQVKLKIANQQIQTTGNLTKRKVELEIGKLSVGYKQAYDAYLRQGDWDNAEDMAEKAVATGAWTPAEYNKNREQGKKDMYQGFVLGEISSSKDEDELNDVSIFIGDNVRELGPENVRQLLTDVNNKRGRMKDEKNQVFKETESEVMLQFMNGKLTTDDLSMLLADERIDPTFAMTMKNQLTTQARDTTGISDPKVILDFMKETSALGMTNGGLTSVSANADILRRKWAIAATGIDPLMPAAPAKEITLKGEDAIKTLEQINKMEKAIIRPEGFSDAVKLIQNRVGIDSMFAITNEAQRNAFYDYYNGLLSYIDKEGMKANPLQWVNENTNVYSVAAYEEEGDKRFILQYPQYKKYSSKVEVKEGAVTKKRDKLDVNAVKADLNRQWREGKISKQEMEKQYFLLTGSAGTVMDANSENQQEFADLLKEINSTEK